MKEYSVSEVNRYIKSLMQRDFVLSNICIKGEISNFKYHTNGHMYFTLKDERSNIKAVIWKTGPKPPFKLEDGLSVIVSGSIEVYDVGGYYQIVVKSIEQAGVGALYVKLAKLKQMFSDMGYFASQYKKPIPVYARKIGIVTAPTGAAIHDIIHISTDRNPYVSLTLCPALVQGSGAAESIVRGIKVLDKMDMDVIIIGRGGGSIEDLWAFNEQIVAEAVFQAKTPIISAVGHDSDDTITDLIADKRAATPSDAARRAVCEWSKIVGDIDYYKDKLRLNLNNKINELRTKSDQYALKLKALSPESNLSQKKMRLESLIKRLNMAEKNIIDRKMRRLESLSSLLKYRMNNNLDVYKIKLDNEHKKLDFLAKSHVEKTRSRLSLVSGKLNTLSPLKLLSSGYGYIENSEGKRVSSVSEVNIDEMVNIYFTDGSAKAVVKEKKNEKR